MKLLQAAVAADPRWAVASNDNHGNAFVIVDKVQARVYVFEADGKLRGTAPVRQGNFGSRSRIASAKPKISSCSG